jgi:hypothetical protein
MDTPQLQHVIPADALRLPDLTLQAGPREIEFEVELPKAAEWDLSGENALTIASTAPEVVNTGEARFNHHSMFFMVPVTALRSGETILTYDLKLAWTEKSGTRCTDQRQVVQRVTVERDRGATVPWVHYKAVCNGSGTLTSGDSR